MIEVKENQLYVDYLGNFKTVICKSLGESINEQFVTYKPLFEGAYPVTVSLESFTRKLTDEEQTKSVTGQKFLHKPIETFKIDNSVLGAFDTKVLDIEVTQRKDSRFFGLKESSVLDDYYAVGRIAKTYLANGDVNERFEEIAIYPTYERARNYYEKNYNDRLIICRVTTSIVG